MIVIMRSLTPYVLTTISLLIAGCQSSGVIQISADTYMISKSDAGPFATISTVRSEVMREVNEFAAKRGKIAVAVSSQSVPRQPGRVPYFEYQFQLLDKDDPRASGVTLKPRPDIVMQSDQKIKAEIKSEGAGSAKTDLYAELTKLDDLRKRSIITDEEFAAQKKRLLER